MFPNCNHHVGFILLEAVDNDVDADFAVLAQYLLLKKCNKNNSRYVLKLVKETHNYNQKYDIKSLARNVKYSLANSLFFTKFQKQKKMTFFFR